MINRTSQLETDVQRIRRIRRQFPSWNSAQILSALGHPGYGNAYAAEVLAATERGVDLFAAALHGSR